MTRQTVVFAKYAAQLVPLWEGDGLELLLLDRLLEEAYLVLIHAELAQHALDFFSAEVARTVRVSIDKGLEQVRLGEQAFGLLHEAQADAEHRDDQREDGEREARGVQHKNHGVLVALREHLVRDDVDGGGGEHDSHTEPDAFASSRVDDERAKAGERREDNGRDDARGIRKMLAAQVEAVRDNRVRLWATAVGEFARDRVNLDQVELGRLVKIGGENEGNVRHRIVVRERGHGRARHDLDRVRVVRPRAPRELAHLSVKWEVAHVHLARKRVHERPRDPHTAVGVDHHLLIFAQQVAHYGRAIHRQFWQPDVSASAQRDQGNAVPIGRGPFQARVEPIVPPPSVDLHLLLLGIDA